MAGDVVFLAVASYASEDDARADLEAVKELHEAGIVGTYDAALVTKGSDGKVVIDKKVEKPTRHGAWTGAGVGAVLWIIFPPGIIGAAVVGAVAGGLIEHFRKGMPRDDVKEIGELLNAGDTGLIVIGEDKLDEAIAKAMTRASKTVQKEINDENKDLQKAMKEAEKDSKTS